MVLSADFSVNASSAQEIHAVEYGATVSLAILSNAFHTIQWRISSTSHPDDVAPTITLAGAPSGATASFPMVADPGDGEGRSVIVSCTVSDQRGTTATATRKVSVANAAGRYAICVDEATEGSATHGWTPQINSLLAGVSVSVRSPIFGATGDGSTDDTAAIQAAIDYVRDRGGGRVYFPKGTYKLIAPYRDEDDIYDGYVANDEMRRANKALIIYDCENIELVGEPGAILDRSADFVADTTYSIHSATLYISLSRNIKVRNLEFRGAMNDEDILDDVKSTTSGDNIQINNGCDSIWISDCVMMDGTNGISVAIHRTSGFQSLDPSLDPCTNIYIDRCEVRNCEHSLLLVDADGVYVNGWRHRRFTREDASTGVIQRGIYLHACRNVHMKNVHLSGAFKTSLILTYFQPVTNVSINGLTIEDMMTPQELIDARTTPIDTPWEGAGIAFQGDNCEDVSFSDLTIKNVTNGVVIPGFGLQRISFRKFRIDAVSGGITYSSNVDTLLTGEGQDPEDNPIEGFTLEDGVIRVYEDAVNYPSITPNTGLYIESSAVNGVTPVNAIDVNTHNVRVYARNRNAKLLLCDGFTTDCVFTRDVTGGGLGGARDFDFNYSGIRRLSNNLYGNKGKPNVSDDTPTAADILGYTNLDGPAYLPSFLVATLPSAALHDGRIVQVTDGDYGNPCLARSDGSNWNVMGSRWGVVSATIPTVTIASGAITVTTDEALVDTEGAAATDDLDTVNGVPNGKRILLRPASSSRDVVVKDGTNIKVSGQCTLANVEDLILLASNGVILREVARSENAAVSTLTIASGVINATGFEHIVDTEASAATDDLDTINGVPAGRLLVIRAASGSRTVSVTEAGNISLASAPFALDNLEDTLTLLSNGVILREIARSDNGA